MTDKIIVLTTCASEEEAERLARVLLDAHLAACVNVTPKVRSFYRWEGAVQDSVECLLTIKTSRGLFDDVRSALEKAHSYDLPEVIAIPVVDGSAAYLKWIEKELRG